MSEELRFDGLGRVRGSQTVRSALVHPCQDEGNRESYECQPNHQGDGPLRKRKPRKHEVGTFNGHERDCAVEGCGPKDPAPLELGPVLSGRPQA